MFYCPIIHLRIIWRVTDFPHFDHKMDDNDDKQNINHKRNDKQNNKCYSDNVVAVIIIITYLACSLSNHKLCV